MRIEFYHIDAMEAPNYEPIWCALKKMGVDARLVTIPDPENTASAGWFDFDKTKEHYESRNVEYFTQSDYKADVAITTQNDNILAPYPGLHVRLMYGPILYTLGWGVSPETVEPFDLIMAHGKNNAEMFSQWKSMEDILVVGYPRYDDYFNNKIDIKAFQKIWNIDKNKPTISYIPTWEHRSSLDAFLPTISALTEKYNVLIKPHHCTLRMERERAEAIYKSGLTILDNSYDLPNVLKVSDVVITDTRSAVFSEAMTADKRTIALSINPDEINGWVKDAGMLDLGVICTEPSALNSSLSKILTKDTFAKARKIWRDNNVAYCDGTSSVKAAELLVEAVEKRTSPKVYAVNYDSSCPSVTVVLPTYNHIQYLHNAIISIMAQTVQDFELIIVNDGSTDGTKEFLDSINHPQIKVIHQNNTKLPGALNAGFMEARGKYLTWTSSDNFLSPVFLETLIKTLDENPQAGMAVGAFAWVNESDQVTRIIKNQDFGYYYNLTCNPGNTAFMYKRECHNEVGLYDTKLECTEDWDMWVRIAEKFSVVTTPDIIYYYKMHANSMTGRKLDQVRIACRRAFEKSLRRHNGQINLLAMYPFIELCSDRKQAIMFAALDLGKRMLDSLAFDMKNEAMQIFAQLKLTQSDINGLTKIPSIASVSGSEEFSKLMEEYRLNGAFVPYSISTATDAMLSLEVQTMYEDEEEPKAEEVAASIAPIVEPIADTSKTVGTRHIMLVTHRFPPHWYAGVENYTYQMAKALIRQGNKVSVLYPLFNSDVKEPFINTGSFDGITIYNIVNTQPTRMIDHANRVENIEAIKNLLKEANVDALHVQHTMWVSFGITNAAKELGIPVFQTLHDAYHLCPRNHFYIEEQNSVCEGPDSTDKCVNCLAKHINAKSQDEINCLQSMLNQWESLAKDSLMACDAVISPSNYIAAKFRKYDYRDDIIVEPLGIDAIQISNSKQGDGRVRLGYLSSIQELKNYHLLAKAFADVKGDITLTFWGNGNEKSIDNLKSLIAEDERIEYKGEYSPKELPELLGQIDVLVMPSITENYPLLVREALSAGIPVVASNAGGMPEIVQDSINGFLFESNNQKSLTAVLQRLADKPLVVDKLSKGITAPKTMDDDAKLWSERYSSYVKKTNNNNVSEETGTSVVIVTYNSEGTIETCLTSVLDSLNIEDELIIVDNKSKDKTIEIAKKLTQKDNRVTVIENDSNVGFSAATNLGIKAGTKPFIALLNPDTFVLPSWTNRLRNHFDDDVAAVGPVSNHAGGKQNIRHYVQSGMDDSISVQDLGKAFYAQMKGQYADTKLLIGFCMMLKRDALNKVGILDNALFLGNDDLDICWRLRLAGYKLKVALDTFVYHEGQVSFKTEPKPKTKALVQESTDILYAKLRSHYGEDNVPTSVELWDVEWFAPSNARFNGTSKLESGKDALPKDADAKLLKSISSTPIIKQKVSIVIPVYNQLEYTKKCIESIEQNTQMDYELILVDNASTDSTADYFRKLSKKKSNFKMVTNKINLGFPSAVNQGLREITGDFALVLNNDTVATPGWLENMVSAMNRDSTLGIVGPITNSISGPQQFDKIEYDIETLEGLDKFSKKISSKYANQAAPFWRIVGFAMMIKRELLDKIGGFDIIYGKGNFEDDDYCLRTALAGYKCAIVLDSFIHHFRSRTFAAQNEDYSGLLHNNWELFKNKWGIPNDIPYGQGFDAQDILNQEFDLHKHYCAFDIISENNASKKTNKPSESEKIRMNDFLSSDKTSSNLSKQLKKGTKRPTISLCMIARDEEDIIEECLRSVEGFADEIIVVDTGSKDRTAQIAKKMGANIFNYKWNNNFSDAKNAAMEHAASDWILFLDADERLDKNAASMIAETITSNKYDAYDLGVLNYLSSGQMPDIEISRCCRLFRNRKNYRYEGAIHEKIVPSIIANRGRISLLDAIIHHHGYKPEMIKLKKKHQRNLVLLKEELKNNPNDVYLLYHLSNEHYSHNEFVDAIRVLEKTRKLTNPKHEFAPLIYSHLIDAYIATGKYDKALEICNESDKINYNPQLLHSKGNVMRLFERYEDAIEAYEAAMLLGHQGLWTGDQATYGYKAHYGAAACYIAIGLFDKAVKQAKEAVKSKPNSKDCQDILEQAQQLLKDNSGNKPESNGRSDMKQKPKLSLCMIVKDEEKFLGQCLESVKSFVDEMIIVDTGSKDSTIEIAKKYGAKVHNFKWTDNFSDARNESLKHASGEWILILDADEKLREDSAESIIKAISTPVADGYELFFINPISLDDMTDYTEHKVCRLFKNKPEYRFKSAIHENIESTILANNGTYTFIDATIIHYGYAASITQERNKADRYISMLSKEVEADPDNVFYLHHLSSAYSAYGNFEKAVPHLEHLVKIAPLNSSFLPIIYANLVNALAEINCDEEGLKYALEGESRGISHPQLYFCKGKALARLSRNEEAIKAYEKTLELGTGLTWNGDTTIVKYKSDLAIATLARDLGQFERAIVHAKKALAGKPNFLQIHELLAQCYAANGEADNYEKKVEDLRKIMPENSGPLVRLAELCEERGDLSEALNKYKEVAELEPENEVVFIKIAAILEDLGKLDDAENYYLKTLELEPDCVQALDGLGLLCAKLGRIEDSLDYFAKAVDANPEYENAYFNAGDVLYQAGAYQQASEIYQNGLSKKSDHAPGFLALGNCYFQMGVYDAAKMSYEQALIIDSNNNEAQNNLLLLTESIESAA